MAKGRRLSKPVKVAFQAQPNGKLRFKGDVAPARSKDRRQHPVKRAVVLARRLRAPAIKHSSVQASSQAQQRPSDELKGKRLNRLE